MLKNAPIILDEATANVAPENGKKLMDAIEALTREKTVITRVRRRKTVRCADQILVLDGGRIVQRGTHEALAAQDGICRRFITERRRAGAGKFNQKGDGREPPAIAFFAAYGA